ncbi:alpha/beta hydrolase family protein [Granulicella tundricola]|uniref:Dipeptidyl aminopeptidase/acylaminoacyl-peptidase-like protein n=1 Tax=Granulicella tundricola (strain ATCC BAA-1859 / DSM 23138 / MP5ACTX9) TaxID=1198114 RepID=E8X250_GRATM|nr:prolyl oligopeptidase family serine peptidase [Granulicella tundricola]ADW70293.1 dipeptidyl aminopeptidase/acylaminoacyl-peptidase-like protein [Granulicella tundricola MP5ACTX9]
MKKLMVGMLVAALCVGFMGASESPEANFKVWRLEIRKALYVPDKLPALEAKTWSTFPVMPGVVADRVTYQTADGMLVPAVVYRPERWDVKVKGKLPGIVVVNGHGGDKFTWYAMYSGMMFAKAGAVVATYDPIGEGERNVERKSHAGAHDKIQAAPAGVDADKFHQDWGQRLAGLMQVDEMQGVAYLASRPEVDAKRIATVGYSMGAFVSGITGAIDPAIHAVVLSGGGTFDDEADGGKSFDTSALPCQGPPWHALRVLGDGPDERGAKLYALNAARGPMFVVNGSLDTVMDIPHRGPDWFVQIRAKAVALGGPEKTMFTTHVDAGMSHRTAWVERPAVEWLNEQIRFGSWTAAEIAAMPTTHVSEWITAGNVDISKGYIREDREGGLQALGTGFPGLQRPQLTVLPDADWERLKGRLTYEAWAEKTMKVAGRS